MFNLPNAGLSLAPAPKLKPPICGAVLLAAGVPNWGQDIPAPKLNPLDAGCTGPVGAGREVAPPNVKAPEDEL